MAAQSDTAQRALCKLHDLKIDQSFMRELPGDPSAENSLRQARRCLARRSTAAARASSASSGAVHLVARARVGFVARCGGVLLSRAHLASAQLLPCDWPLTFSRSQVVGAFYTPVQPTPADGDPTLIAASADTAALLGLDPREFGTAEFVRCFGGVEVPRAWKPWAQCYGGHQFGSWAGQLGDGRAISLTEVINASGERWELQLKGAGKTPYSRRADGRAVLRSSLREYVASEAMQWLGIPTTRALSLVATNDAVLRDMFYDGRAKLEPGAIVCRVARCFIRFGTFQLPASRSEDANVALLADYTIKHHYPHLQGREDARAAWFNEVCERTAKLAAAFQAVGFVHGVLNTGALGLAHRGRVIMQHTDAPFLARQHVHLGRLHRLWAVRLDGEVRPGVHAQHHRL